MRRSREVAWHERDTCSSWGLLLDIPKGHPKRLVILMTDEKKLDLERVGVVRVHLCRNLGYEQDRTGCRGKELLRTHSGYFAAQLFPSCASQALPHESVNISCKYCL